MLNSWLVIPSVVLQIIDVIVIVITFKSLRLTWIKAKSKSVDEADYDFYNFMYHLSLAFFLANFYALVRFFKIYILDNPTDMVEALLAIGDRLLMMIGYNGLYLLANKHIPDWLKKV